jgi:cell division protein FtsL
VVVISALAVVYSSYKSRQLFAQLQQEHRRSIQLEEEWGRLLLEQSTWASHSRIEQVASSKLGMKVPNSSDIKVIK